VIDDAELARRSILGFGETVASMGRWGVGADIEVRRPDAIGARICLLGDQPWLNAAVVPSGVAPPGDDPGLPYCLWAEAAMVRGRVERPDIALPCMGMTLDGPDGAAPEAAPLEAVADVNEGAYDQPGLFGRMLRSLAGDPRVRGHGLRDAGGGGPFVCVALTMAVDDDISIQYVATRVGHRRRGLASRLLLGAMAAAREEGARTATLQASPMGLPVYERLGFRRVATLRAHLRPGSVAA
jgi:ribosomal protein S18 acetylase RimI-like enzyme